MKMNLNDLRCLDLHLQVLFFTFLLINFLHCTDGVGAPMTPADSPSCSSHSISYDVQSCVPQYLADLWQGKNFLTLGQNHHTKQVLRSKVCQEQTVLSSCLKDKFDECNLSQDERDNATETLLPELSALSTMCQTGGNSGSCSVENLKSCMRLLPADINDAKKENYLKLCPKLRVASACFSAYSCETDVVRSKYLSAADSWLNENGVDANNAFFDCNSGIPPSGELGSNKVSYENVTVELELDFHCESEYLFGCGYRKIWYKKPENRSSFTSNHESCASCGVDRPANCKSNQYFNFGQTSCLECSEATGSKKVGEYLCEKSDTQQGPFDSSDSLKLTSFLLVISLTFSFLVSSTQRHD